MKKSEEKRQSNIELLRIVLMVMIILLHSVVHSCEVSLLANDNYTTTHKSPYYLFLLSFSMVAVNSFVFISGYYGIKFRLKTIISLILQAIFYSVLIYTLVGLFVHKALSIDLIKHGLFPISFSEWWFLNIFLALYIASPIINKGIELLSKSQFQFIILSFLFFEITYPLTGNNILSGAGYSFHSFLTIYLLARYAKKYKLDISKPWLLYIASALILFALSSFAVDLKHQSLAWRLFAYNSPLIIMGSIFLFYSFLHIKIKHSKAINTLATLVFGIYLIHDHSVVRHFLKGIVSGILSITNNGILTIFLLVAISLGLFLICAGIEYIRSLLFKPLTKKTYAILTKYFPNIDTE